MDRRFGSAPLVEGNNHSQDVSRFEGLRFEVQPLNAFNRQP